MPRSSNQKHHHWRPHPAGNWDIDDPHKFLAKDGGARVLVDEYMQQTGYRQPQAEAELLMAGYASLISSQNSPAAAPPAADDIDNDGGSGDMTGRVSRLRRDEQSGSKGKKAA